MAAKKKKRRRRRLTAEQHRNAAENLARAMGYASAAAAEKDERLSALYEAFDKATNAQIALEDASIYIGDTEPSLLVLSSEAIAVSRMAGQLARDLRRRLRQLGYWKKAKKTARTKVKRSRR